MSSPIPGDDERSEGSEVSPRPGFKVDGDVEVPRSEASVEEDLRGGGDDFKIFNEV